MSFVNVKEYGISATRPSDIILDVTTSLRVFSQILSEGDVTDEYAAEISWLLGSLKKRLEPICELLEQLEGAGMIEISHEAFRIASANAGGVSTGDPAEKSDSGEH